MSRMVTLALLALLLVIGLVAYDTWRGDKDAKWHADAEREIALGRAALAEKDTLTQRLDSLQSAHAAERDSLQREAARSDSAKAASDCRVSQLRARLAAVDALPFDSVRDPLLADMGAEIDSLQGIVAAQSTTIERQDRLIAAQATEIQTVMRMSHGLAVRLDSALAVLERRPKERPWWLPEVTAGVTGCWCGGKPEIGPGVTIGKSVRF